MRRQQLLLVIVERELLPCLGSKVLLYDSFCIQALWTIFWACVMCMETIISYPELFISNVRLWMNSMWMILAVCELRLCPKVQRSEPRSRSNWGSKGPDPDPTGPLVWHLVFGIHTHTNILTSEKGSWPEFCFCWNLPSPSSGANISDQCFPKWWRGGFSSSSPAWR